MLQIMLKKVSTFFSLNICKQQKLHVKKTDKVSSKKCVFGTFMIFVSKKITA